MSFALEKKTEFTLAIVKLVRMKNTHAKRKRMLKE